MTVTQTPECRRSTIPPDRRLALGATGLLRIFNEAGVLEAADVHVATRLAALSAADGPPDESVTLAMALTVRAMRTGSVCVDLAAVAADSERPELPWPDCAASGWPRCGPARCWLRRRCCGCTATGCCTWTGTGCEEEQVCAELLGRLGADPPVDAAALAAGLDRVFHRPELRRAAGRRRDCVVAVDDRAHRRTGHRARPPPLPVCWRCWPSRPNSPAAPGLRIALAAPTGKASARLQEAVQAEIDNLGASPIGPG